jgi:hypothetical protein
MRIDKQETPCLTQHYVGPHPSLAIANHGFQTMLVVSLVVLQCGTMAYFIPHAVSEIGY